MSKNMRKSLVYIGTVSFLILIIVGLWILISRNNDLSKDLAEANQRNVIYRGTIAALGDQSMVLHNENVQLDREINDIDRAISEVASTPNRKEVTDSNREPSPDGLYERPHFTRAEAEAMYKKANACLLSNIVAIQAGSNKMDNYPDLSFDEALDLDYQLQEAGGFQDLRQDLTHKINKYFDLVGGGYSRNGIIGDTSRDPGDPPLN